MAVVETFALKRKIAPIEEPSEKWIKDLAKIFLHLRKTISAETIFMIEDYIG